MSAKQAIKKFCKGCIYDPLAGGTWLEQVENCTITQCELYDYRPLTAKTRKNLDEKKLAMLSVEERGIIEVKRKNARENMLNLHTKVKQ